MNKSTINQYIITVNKASNVQDSKKIVQFAFIETGLGVMIAASTEKGICMLEFPDYKGLLREFSQLSQFLKAQLVEEDSFYISLLQRQITEYFTGERHTFDIPLDCVGTDFQKTVWQAISTIAYGKISTYSQLAINIGKPSAVRAIANANGNNKIAIVIPCHRIIGANGSLTGYAGGLARKEKLLTLERYYSS